MGAYESIEDIAYSDRSDIDETVKKVKTGDIVLFAGRSFFSDAVRCLGSLPDWSHIGIVIRPNDAENSEAYLFESTKETEPMDEITREFKDGPKLVKLYDKLKDYDGYLISYRRLRTGRKSPESNELRKEWADALMAFAKECVKKGYETDYSQLIGSLFRSNRSRDTSAYFCIELVAYCLMKIGVISKEVCDADNFTLMDFAEGLLPLKGGYYFDPVVYII